MKFEQLVSECHIASLKQDIIPPDPRLHCRVVSSNELTVSLGSLIFISKPKHLKVRGDFNGKGNVVLPPEGYKRVPPSQYLSISSDVLSAIGCDTEPTSPRDEYIPENDWDFENVTFNNNVILRCAINTDQRQVSDVVEIKLKHGDFLLQSCCLPDSPMPRTKHRNTYMGGANRRPLSGVNFVRCKIYRRPKTVPCFALKRLVKYKVKSSNQSYQRNNERLSAVYKKLMKTIGIHKGDTIPEFMDSFVKKALKRECKHCKDGSKSYTRKIEIPIILHINTLLRFRLTPECIPNCVLILSAEIYVGGELFATSATEFITGTHKVQSDMMMFSEENKIVISPLNRCTPLSCCCKIKERKICSTHTLQIQSELKSLVYFIFKYNPFLTSAKMGKYRYLLYFYLQMLTYSRMNAMNTCREVEYIALMTVGIVDFTEPLEQEDDAILQFRMALSGNTEISDQYVGNQNSADAIDHWPICVNLIADQIFEQAEIRTAKLAVRRVSTIFMTSDDPVDSLKATQCHLPQMPIPTFEMPTDLDVDVNEDFFRYDEIICKTMVHNISVYSGIFITSKGRVFLPESRDVAFLKSMLSTPLYCVGVCPDRLDSLSVNTPLGSVSYRSINKLMWRYTHILVQFSDTLPTFLRFVDWRDQKETIYALEAIYRWKYPTLGTMLELLSKDFCPPRAPEAIRIYATERIFRKYGIDDLVRVFPQLINAYGSCYVMNRLISLGSKQRTTAIMLYWALETWLRDNDIGYKNQFLRELKNEEHGNDILEGIEAQKLFRDSLRALMKPLNGETISYRKKAEIIAKSFSRSHTADAFYGLDPYVGDDGSTLFNAQIPFFTDPRWEIESLIKDKCRVIKTSKCPLILKFGLLNLGTDTTREDGSISHNTPTEWRKYDTPMRMEKRVLFKYKDDLRLDQLCQQIAMLCRTLLEGHGVKSYIFTYKVVPTSHNDGFLDIVDETKALSDILNDYGSIGGYVFEDNPSAFEEFCRRLNFVGSLAAYSAITYILGVGDRHNDNLIISRSGHVIHVDYGYILGADPKPLPAAPFKLSKELLKFMGGYNSFLYNKFKMRFYLVYSVLRHHAKLIITMLYLLLDSKLHNVNLDNIIKMESKFFLSANSISTTRKYANNLVESSAIAVSSALAETWHSYAMSWR